MRKTMAMTMLLVLVLGLFGCSAPNDNDATSDNGSKNDGLVSVWLVTSITNYEPDGSKGTHRETYTYTDKGLPLTMSVDNGVHSEEWSEEDGVYYYSVGPYDGNIDKHVEYFYNEHGDYLYYTQTTKSFNAAGEETQSKVFSDGKDTNYTYHRDANGRIESVDMYPILVGGGHGEEPNGVMHYSYDDDGNLIEISIENLTDGNIRWCYDYRYDQQGRIIGSSVRQIEVCRYYQYEYDQAGRLSYVSLSTGQYQVALDDQHVVDSSLNYGETQLSLRSEMRFVYDDDGNLIARGSDTCTYKDGKLSTVTYGDGNKYVYVDDEKDANPEETTLVRDKHGNVIKIMDANGYTEYTYQEFRLTEEEAAICRNVQLAYRRIDPFGHKALNTWIPFVPGGHINCLPTIPSTVFHFTDIIETA